MNGWVVLLWSFVAALVIIVVGIFVALTLMGRITLFPETGSSEAPAPEVTGVIDTSYSVLVLNATPESGLEAQVRETLLNSGWTADSVSSSPAGTQDFSQTTVYYVADDDQLAAIGLADAIGGALVEQSDYLSDPNDPEQKQLVVAIGLDRATAAETPAE